MDEFTYGEWIESMRRPDEDIAYDRQVQRRLDEEQDQQLKELETK